MKSKGLVPDSPSASLIDEHRRETPDTAPRLSKERPPIRQRNIDSFDWNSLIPIFVHEVKVATLEAMSWIGQPLSSSELQMILGEKWPLGTIAYHVNTLAARDVIEVTDERAVRGARETYYFLADRKRSSSV